MALTGGRQALGEIDNKEGRDALAAKSQCQRDDAADISLILTPAPPLTQIPKKLNGIIHKICTACGNSLPEAAYSKKQWSWKSPKLAERRRCNVCVKGRVVGGRRDW